uniref:Coiled-coil SMC6 And NSE5 INteracting (CANIN) domain-containing protein n=1 Tax=Oryzias sinensis TaxID=183150 RepID=A0A8C7X4R9_9TELE
MKKASENQDNSSRLSDYSSSRNKVMDLTPQQPPPHHFTAFPQETPMKPSQVPNRLSHPSPRRVLPLHTPGKERFHPHLHHSGGVAPNNPPNADTPLSTETGPPKDCVEPRGLVPSSLSSSCSTVSPRNGTERERKGSFQKSSLSESKHHSSSQPVPVTHNNRGLADVPSSGCSQRSSSQCLHNVKERLASGQAVKHQETESKFATSTSNDTQRRHDPFKRHHHHPRTSSENNIPAPYSSCSSHKRRRESEHRHNNAKKPCPDGPDSSKTPSISAVSHPVLKNSSLLELSHKKATECAPCTERTQHGTNEAGSTGSKEVCSGSTEKKDVKSSSSSKPRDERHRRRKKQAPERVKENVSEDDSIDGELDLGQNFACNLDLTQSSDTSEEENLMSLQEIMEPVPKVLCTPEKRTFSEPSTPGNHNSQSKSLLPSAIKSGVYRNNLDELMKEMNNNKKAKEVEAQLLSACKDDLFRIPDSEEMEESQEEGISTEQQEFLQRYSLMSSVIREVPPGEEVFNLERFGCIFNQDALQLRQCLVNPQTAAQKALLWSSPAQLRLHVNIGLFQEAYDFFLPCPAQVTHFLFKMMSVHNERMVSDKILHILCDIACAAAYQIAKNGSHRFKVWVPSLADVTLVLMNMGVGFVTLFPFENLQPPFTERDLLDNDFVKPESPSTNRDDIVFHEYNYINVLKYLSYCMGLCPHSYSDNELLLLLTVVEKVSLDTHCILQSSVDVNALLYKIVNNIKDWDAMLPRICLALTDLTEDHQNMCLLVQLLPDHTRGKELRRHLSLCMISKLLEGNCTYRPTQNEFQLAELRPYLPRMQPSALLRGLQQKNSEEDLGILDQQAYYLCYSLLTLANEASNLQVFPPHQKEQLLVLSSELETRVKCDIRESEKCLYRSKLKDLVARIYTKWQMLLQRTRPLNGKLYDYYIPLEITSSSQDEEEGTVEEMNEEEQDSLSTDEDEGSTTAEEEDKIEGLMEEVNDPELSQTSDNEGDTSKDDTNTVEEAVTSDLQQGSGGNSTPIDSQEETH